MSGSIPKWVLWTALGVVVLSITGVLFVFFGLAALLFLVLSVVVLGFGFAGYRVFGNIMASRKASPFVQGLSFNAGASPSNVTDPSQRARLDDLRRRFEDGVETFKSHGKSLYDMPWYLLVGEPGSGKTEAVRHCNVGFPPGLQDQLQGAGGTLNMNWWFTNHAVILDTAGRLMFEQGSTGPSNEWREFLKLLRRHRPTCPVNGLLLVIPADSLIRDTTEELERKGSKIAEQLDFVQRELGVRFPVFTVVTKCDLITGFREFFDGIDDPQLQHQMLGWSNPNPLDEPFVPDQLSEHLNVVRERLRERRNGLMIDAKGGGKTQQASLEAMYAFPEALMRITPRLRRYLEMIFVSGEWATKPLFLRGIYFNSSMREGAALDEDLAQALGMDVDAMPGGKVWEKDKAYFLRDLFMGKVFQERGLVTSAGNAKQQQRGRRLLVLGSGVAAAVLLIAMTVFSSVSFKQSLGEPQLFWASAADRLGRDDPDSTHIVGKAFAGDAAYEYRGGRELPFGTPPTTLARVTSLAVDRMKEDSLSPPLVFAPVAWISGDPESLRRPAIRGMFESTVLGPVLDAAREKLGSIDADAWDAEATSVLTEFLSIEVALASGPAAFDAGSPIDITALLRFILSDEEFAEYEGADRDAIERVAAWAYSSEAGGVWPPPAATTGDESSRSQLASLIDRFVASMSASLGTDGGRYRTVLELREQLELFGVVEVRLQGLSGEYGEVATSARSQAFRESWMDLMGQLRETRGRLASLTAKLGDSVDLPVADLVATSREDALDGPRATFDRMLGVFEGLDESEASLGELRDALDRGWARVGEIADERLGSVGDDLTRMKADLLDTGTGGQRRFEKRFRMYEVADGWVARSSPSPELGGVREAIRELRTTSRVASDEIDRIAGASSGLASFSQAREAASHALRAGLRAQYEGLVRARVNDAPFNPDSLGEEIAARASSLTPMDKPAIPLSGLGTGRFDGAFHPEAAGAVLDDWVAVGEVLEDRVDSDGQPGIVDGRLLQEEFNDLNDDVFGRYAEDYLEYWGERVRGDASFDRRAVTTWEGFHERLRRLEPRELNRRLRSLHEMVLSALSRVPDSLADGSDRDALITEFRAELELLEQRDFAADAADAILSWAELPADAREARARLLSLTPVRFERTYLSVYGEYAESPGVRYWNEMLFAGLDTLAAASRNESRDLMERLISDFRGFPLCVTPENGPELSGAQLQSAIELVNALGESDQGGESFDENSIGAGRTTRFDRVNETLSSLLGEELFGGETGQWFDRVARVAGSLERLSSATVEVLVPTAQDERPSIPGMVGLMRAYPSYRYLRVGTGGPGGTVFAADTPGPVQPALAMPTEGGLSLAFLEREDVAPGGETGGESPWTVLRWLTAPGSARDSQDPTLWRVPIVFKDSAGRNRYYWVGIRLDAELPPASEWPKSGDWPGGLP